MNHRERTMAVLRYQDYDRLPLLHFGFWRETLDRWAAEGHLSFETAQAWGDGNAADDDVSAQLGFDGNYYTCFHPRNRLHPPFEKRVVKTFPDGTRHVMNAEGVVVQETRNAGGIPSEVEHLFQGRREWEEHYKHRLRFFPERVLDVPVKTDTGSATFQNGGLEFLRSDRRDFLYNLHCGSLFGQIRNFIGMENCCYLAVDDEPLFNEIIDTVGELSYQCVKTVLECGAKFDFGHFWEDICFKNGPLVTPSVFKSRVGPHYRRICALLQQHGIDIVSLDCDGKIDALIPTWMENGVNTMFPIEVGTWNASIAPWREQYGRELRGVGGMNKVLFARDRKAIDREIERLKPLVELGGFIPCPDHRIAPDAEWDNVRYYCDTMHDVFS